MRSGISWFVVLVLLVVIAFLGWQLYGTPFEWGMTATSTPQQTDNTDTGTDTDDTNTGFDVDALRERVVIDAPQSGQSVFANFTVTGKAPGPWYFEASFPIEVRSATGAVVATGHATALTEWMTTADVPFKAEISVPSYKGAATLVLMRDNASGLPQFDASISIPITIQ